MSKIKGKWLIFHQSVTKFSFYTIKRIFVSVCLIPDVNCKLPHKANVRVAFNNLGEVIFAKEQSRYYSIFKLEHKDSNYAFWKGTFERMCSFTDFPPPDCRKQMSENKFFLQEDKEGASTHVFERAQNGEWLHSSVQDYAGRLIGLVASDQPAFAINMGQQGWKVSVENKMLSPGVIGGGSRYLSVCKLSDGGYAVVSWTGHAMYIFNNTGNTIISLHPLESLDSILLQYNITAFRNSKSNIVKI